MSKGFRLPERTARLQFSGTDYDGAEVVVTLKVKIGKFREWSNLGDSSAGVDEMADVILQIVREWNVEDDEGPIPVSVEGIDRIDDVGFLVAIMDGWRAATAGVTEVDADLKAS